MSIPSIFSERKYFAVVGGLALILFGLGSEKSSAQGYADLFDFNAQQTGCCPQHPSVLAQGRDGYIYGTTASAGANRIGIVFKISPSGGQHTLYSFDTVHGSTPIGGLVLGVDGNLYGTTEEGGANGYGNIFRITPAGALTVLYDFTGAADGGLPVSPLIVGLDGAFYGTSYPGMAYKISPSGNFQVLGKIPATTFGPLLQAKDGLFYGVTEFGGTHSAGTVYKINGKTVTTLYSFDGPHGSYPIGGLVQGTDGNLWGTTTAGGATNAGVIYKITPAGVLSVVISFDSVHPLGGYQMYGGLIAGSDGNLYGATIWGGQYGYGVIFKLTTGGAYSVLYDFQAPTGDGAYSTPMEATSGVIYGMTSRGGFAGKGVIYAFSDGLKPYALPSISAGPVGKTIPILGNGFSVATGVKFGGTPASFHVVSNTYLSAVVPAGTTGSLTVSTASGTLVASRTFKVTPTITALAPTSGRVGATIVLTGTGLIQSSAVTVGGVKATAFTVNSDSQVTLKVPTGAITGKVAVTTPGGKVNSSGTFTVTP